MTKLCLIADTHGNNDLLEGLPPVSVTIHCGDATRYGSRKELEEFARVFSACDSASLILVAGNHDGCFQKHPEESLEIMEGYGITYLQDNGVVIDGYKFYGVPWTPAFNDWHFMGSFVELYERWAKVPHDVDVLISHGPPKYLLDLSDGDHAGSAAHGAHMALVRPKLNVFGHIHEGYGRVYFDETMYINCSLLNRAYEAVNAPVVYELPAR